MLLNPQQKPHKAHSDLYHLLKAHKTIYQEGKLIKYSIQQGSGDTLGELQEKGIPFKFYFMWIQYDFDGCIIWKQLRTSCKMSHLEDERLVFGMKKVLRMMKNKEKSWFKMTDSEDYQNPYLQYKGCYFQIHILDINYSNSQRLQAKKRYFEQSCQHAKKLFHAGKFQKALRIYYTLINTTQNFAKNLYSQLQLRTLKQMNHRGKANYLRCLVKIPLVSSKMEQLGDSYSRQLQRQSNDETSLYLRALTLYKFRYLQDSLAVVIKAKAQNLVTTEVQWKSLQDRIQSQINKKKNNWFKIIC